MYKVVLSKRAIKDVQKIVNSGLKEKVLTLINVLKENPLQSPPTFEKLRGI